MIEPLVLVSIIVPCYKQAHFLSEALQSVLEQTYPHWECIIVNDGSTDHTEEIAHQWVEKDPRFKYVYQDNGGLSSARNCGIKQAAGEFILPLDADDKLHEDYLKLLVPELVQNPNIAIVSCYSKFFLNKQENIIHELKPKGYNYLYLLYVNQLIATSLYRKECWKEVGGYDESMKKGFEDWEFWLAITKTGWEYIIVQEFLFYYRKADKSMLTNTIRNNMEEVKQYIFTKHKELYIQDFNNCMEVLFYELKVQRIGYVKYKNALEYKIGKVILKPFKMLSQLFSKAKSSK